MQHFSKKQVFRAHQSGVTLVELSVVLVILSLLIGGVVAGISLLRGAEFRRVISEYQRFQMAVTTFQTSHGHLPGDMPDATEVWGMAPSYNNPAADDAACAALTNASPSQGTLTCNGDGDGAISVGYEEYRAWQQLSNANLIEGNYTGVGSTATAGEGFQADVNCPKSAFRDACWRLFYRASTSAQRTPFRLFEGDYETHLLSLWGGVTDESQLTPVLTPAEMWEMDNKIDDGKPATGALVVPHGSGAGNPFTDCTRDTASGTAAESEVDAVYNADGATRSCQPYIKVDF